MPNQRNEANHIVRQTQWRLCYGTGMCGSQLFIDGVTADRGNRMHCEVYKAIPSAKWC